MINRQNERTETFTTIAEMVEKKRKREHFFRKWFLQKTYTKQFNNTKADFRSDNIEIQLQVKIATGNQTFLM